MTVTYLIWLVLLLAVLAIGAWVAWRFWGPASGLFGGTQAARIGLSETFVLDGKRRLMLIYRDGVEHLVMTGGPVDVVIEQGIQPNASRRAASPAPAAVEPRLAPQPAYNQLDEPTQQPAYGKLRQRGPAAAPEPGLRPEGVGKPSSGGNR